jgi:LAO/AO transport system kinase
VWAVVEDHRARLVAANELETRRRHQQQAWFWSMIDDGLKRHFLAREDVARLLPEMEAAVAGAKLTPTEAARRLLAVVDTDGDGGARSAATSRRNVLGRRR